jgi:hypothetical protein
MNIKNIFLLFSIFTIPGNIESFLNYSNNNGNMGLHGVYLDIYHKRNLYYFSLIIFAISYFFKYTFYGFLINLLFLYFFLSIINKWCDIILINIPK